MNETTEKVMLVVVGAIVGAASAVVSATYSTRLQARETDRQRSIERKLDTIKAYSAACHRQVVVGRRRVELVDAVFGLSAEARKSPQSPPQPPEVTQYLIRQFETLEKEAADSTIELRTEVDVVNGLFGTTLPSPPEIEVVRPSDAEPLAAQAQAAQAQLQKFRLKLPALAEECGANAKLLIAKLQ